MESDKKFYGIGESATITAILSGSPEANLNEGDFGDVVFEYSSYQYGNTLKDKWNSVEAKSTGCWINATTEEKECEYKGLINNLKEGNHRVYTKVVAQNSETGSAKFPVFDVKMVKNYLILEDTANYQLNGVLYLSMDSLSAYSAEYRSDNKETQVTISVFPDRRKLFWYLDYLIEKIKDYSPHIDKVGIKNETIYFADEAMHQEVFWTSNNLLIQISGKINSNYQLSGNSKNYENNMPNRAYIPTEIVQKYMYKHPSDVVQEGEEYVLALDKGWNLFTVPIYQVQPTRFKKFQNDCRYMSHLWAFDNKNKKYYRKDYATDSLMEGYWIKVASNCTVTIIGDTKLSMLDLSEKSKLYRGWNIIGKFYNFLNLKEAIRECMVEMGPYVYDPSSGSYIGDQSILSGKAYAIKVGNNCSLMPD